MKTIAFIGLGRMGLPMASNLIKAGFDVIGCDLDAGRRDALAGHGGQVAATPAEAVARADMSISMIMNDAILRTVAMGPEGVFAGAREGHVYADLSTVSPAASAEVAAAVASGRHRLCVRQGRGEHRAGGERGALALRVRRASGLRPVRAGVRGHGGQARLCGRGRGGGLSQARAQHDRGHVLGHAGRGAGLRRAGRAGAVDDGGYPGGGAAGLPAAQPQGAHPEGAALRLAAVGHRHARPRTST